MSFWLSPRIKQELETTRTNMLKMNDIIDQYAKMTNEQNDLITELTKNNQLNVELAAQQQKLIDAHEAHSQKQKEAIFEMQSIIKSQGEQLKKTGLKPNSAP